MKVLFYTVWAGATVVWFATSTGFTGTPAPSSVPSSWSADGGTTAWSEALVFFRFFRLEGWGASSVASFSTGCAAVCCEALVFVPDFEGLEAGSPLQRLHFDGILPHSQNLPLLCKMKINKFDTLNNIGKILHITSNPSSLPSSRWKFSSSSSKAALASDARDLLRGWGPLC